MLGSLKTKVTEVAMVMSCLERIVYGGVEHETPNHAAESTDSNCGNDYGKDEQKK